MLLPILIILLAIYNLRCMLFLSINSWDFSHTTNFAFTSLSFFFIPPHLQTISLSPIFKWKAAQNFKANLKKSGEHSFHFTAPSDWNSLPATLRNISTLSQFISHLKTFLFAKASQQNLVLSLKKGGMSVCGLLNVDGCTWIGRGQEGEEG